MIVAVRVPSSKLTAVISSGAGPPVDRGVAEPIDHRIATTDHRIVSVVAGVHEPVGEVEVGDQPGLVASERGVEGLLDLIRRPRNFQMRSSSIQPSKNSASMREPIRKFASATLTPLTARGLPSWAPFQYQDRLGLVVGNREVVPATGIAAIVGASTPVVSGRMSMPKSSSWSLPQK